MKDDLLLNKAEATKIYDKRYHEGYIEDWPVETKNRICEIIQNSNLPQKGKALDFGCGTGNLGSDSPFIHFYFDKDDTCTVLKTSYSFDDLDRLTRIEYKKASNNALIRKVDYTYNSQNFIETRKIYDASSFLFE